MSSFSVCVINFDITSSSVSHRMLHVWHVRMWKVGTDLYYFISGLPICILRWFIAMEFSKRYVYGT